MKYDYRKLKGKIKEVFDTQVVLANKLGISERSISLKLNNKRDFSQKEIHAICDLLHIGRKYIPLYFFTPLVQKGEQKTVNIKSKEKGA